MYIPLDNLYEWMTTISSDTLIYRFYPHGSKNLYNLRTVNSDHLMLSWYQRKHLVPMFCNDQEPLSYDLYDVTTEELQQIFLSKWPERGKMTDAGQEHIWTRAANRNIASLVDGTVSDCYVLLHSEKRSSELEKYQNSCFVGAYWWSHGMIARNWYRFAPHDGRLKVKTDYNYDFNMYSRAWTNTREYRLTLLEMLTNYNLLEASRITFSSHDNDVHYKNYQFVNPNLSITSDLENIPTNQVTSCSSANMITTTTITVPWM